MAFHSSVTDGLVKCLTFLYILKVPINVLTEWLLDSTHFSELLDTSVNYLSVSESLITYGY